MRYDEFIQRLSEILTIIVAIPILLLVLFFLVVTMPFWVIPYAISRWGWKE